MTIRTPLAIAVAMPQPFVGDGPLLPEDPQAEGLSSHFARAPHSARVVSIVCHYSTSQSLSASEQVVPQCARGGALWRCPTIG